jgi:hypothetical protein
VSSAKRTRTGASRVGADEALTTLVSQFADPLVFLRELVQNSLDAAATQIDVDFTYDDGVMTIRVTDNGEGMNEQIIDKYLLTLFSSTKENDLTKIGKFGVGFVSIFAIEPELVVLETGQAGESWRILFHPDKTFEKLRLDEPIEGTTIALHKRVPKGEFKKLENKGAATVRYWCKYAEADIAANGDPIGEELGLDAALSHTHREPGTELIVGFAPLRGDADKLGWKSLKTAEAATALLPLAGFYNRGLTLVESHRLPEERSDDLAGLSMRVKSRYLEHTLTRDNVRADDNYYKAIELVRGQVDDQLRPRLIAHLEKLAAHACGDGDDPGPPDLPTSLLYARLPSMQLHRVAREARIIPTADGPPVSLRQLERQKAPIDEIPVAFVATPVTALLARQKVHVVLAGGGVVKHLQACDLACAQIHTSFYTATPVELSEAAEALLPRLQELLDRAKARVERVVFGELDHPHSTAAGKLCVRQEEAFGLTRVGDDDQPTLFGGARQLVLGVSHRLVKRCIAMAERRPSLAAHLLAQAVCAVEAVDVDRRVEIGRLALRWHHRKGAAS